MVNLHKHHPSTQGEAAQVLQDRLDHQGLASNQNQILPDQSHQNPLRKNARQQAPDPDALRQAELKRDRLDEGGLDEEDLRGVPLDESKLDPQERQVRQTQRYAPSPDHASPARQAQDQRKLEKHTSNEQVDQARHMEKASKNPQVPHNQQHQAPGSEPLNQVKQQQGIDTLIDNN
jgi:hypothetical protein